MRIFLTILALTIGCGAFSAKNKREPAVNLDGHAKRALVEAALLIKKGDSYEAVVSKLGKPTFDQVLQRKEEKKAFGRSLKYYVVVWDAGLVNEIHDEYIVVNLDDRDQVQSVAIRVTLKE